jgi:DNA-binding NarL/FixJ family response regulator
MKKLTSREDETLGLAAQGLTDKEIASTVGVSRSTIETYWMRIRQKLSCRSRTHAVGMILQEKLDDCHARVHAFLHGAKSGDA